MITLAYILLAILFAIQVADRSSAGKVESSLGYEIHNLREEIRFNTFSVARWVLEKDEILKNGLDAFVLMEDEVHLLGKVSFKEEHLKDIPGSLSYRTEMRLSAWFHNTTGSDSLTVVVRESDGNYLTFREMYRPSDRNILISESEFPAEATDEKTIGMIEGYEKNKTGK